MSRGVRWAIFIALCGAFFAHAAYYYPFLSDDAMISLRYARRLCQGDGLTWTDGVRVEGYTNLLWVLLNAPATCLGADPIWSARVIGSLGVVAATFILALPLRGGTIKPSLPRLIGGSLCLVLSPPVVVYAIGGLEQGFMTAPLAAALYFTLRGESDKLARRDAFLAGCFFAMLALLRADGVVLFAAATLGRWIAARLRLQARTELAWAAPVVGVLACQLAFRLAYYGEWIPNTALAKVSFNEQRLELGAEWILGAWKPLAVLIGAAVISTVLTAKRLPRSRYVIPWAIFFGWSAYVTSVGGDIFLAWRQICPVFVPLALLVADAAEQIAKWPIRRAIPALVVWLGLSAGSFFLQTADPSNRAVKSGLWEWEGLPVGKALKRAFKDKKPLLAVDAAGALPFWSELPALDMLGLNDHHIPRHPHPEFGRGPIGHELGDGEYVWRRKPDIIAFCGFRGNPRPCFRGGKQLFAKRAFRNAYQLVHVQGRGRGPAGALYFRREGGPLGFVRSPDQVTIPGYFFAQGTAVARSEKDGSLATQVTPHTPGLLQRLTLSAGTWVAKTRPSDPDVGLVFRCRGRPADRDPAGDPTAVKVDDGMRVDVIVELRRLRSEPFHLREMSFIRSDATRAAFRCSRRSARH
jgi:hypothetical protein